MTGKPWRKEFLLAQKAWESKWKTPSLLLRAPDEGQSQSEEKVCSPTLATLKDQQRQAGQIE
jgi:hypothetical protein